MRKFIEKTNQYLLTHCPLVWNTKIVWALPAALLIHALFYLAGYSYPFEIKELDYYYSLLSYNENVVMISVLVSLLFVIVWLLSYLKNNAFKSVYPTSKPKLFAEFVMIFVVLLFSSTFFQSYTWGKYHKIEAEIQHNENEYMSGDLLNHHSLSKIASVRKGLWEWWFVLGWFYTTLGMSILLFAFRATSLRTWFAAIIGSIVVFIALALITVLFWGSISHEESFLLFYILVGLVFGLTAWISIVNKGNKLVSGGFLLWFFAAVPFLVPLFVYWVQELYAPHYYYTQPNHPVYDWIRDNWTLIHTGNIAWVFLVTAFVIVPLAYRWRSNPEE